MSVLPLEKIPVPLCGNKVYSYCPKRLTNLPFNQLQGNHLQNKKLFTIWNMSLSHRSLHERQIVYVHEDWMFVFIFFLNEVMSGQFSDQFQEPKGCPWLRTTLHYSSPTQLSLIVSWCRSIIDNAEMQRCSHWCVFLSVSEHLFWIRHLASDTSQMRRHPGLSHVWMQTSSAHHWKPMDGWTDGLKQDEGVWAMQDVRA